MNMELKRKKSLQWIVVALLTIIVAGVGLAFYINASHYESTNDAQIDANLVSVKSSVTAYVERIAFTDNEKVRKGQLLVAFDTTELQTKVSEALAEYENAIVNLFMAENSSLSGNEDITAYNQNAASVNQDVLSADATLEKSQKNYDRTRKLFLLKAATQEQLDNAKASLDIAQSDHKKYLILHKSSLSTVNSYRLKQKENRNKIEQAKIAIRQKGAALALARINLSHAFVYAPCDGFATKRAIQEGQYISAGQSICCVVNNTDYWVTANFKETQIHKLKVGQTVEVKIDAYPDLKLKGTVSSFTEATGAKFSLIPPDNASGNFTKVVQRIPVKIKLSGIDQKLRNSLFPGMSVYIRVNTNQN